MCVTLLSWTDDDKGSVGELGRIGSNGFDRVDNVLLELTLALALRDEPSAAVQAVLPVLIGPARTVAEGGGFAAFPFHKLKGLSDEPSKATNAQAGAILKQLGLSEDKLEVVRGRSVKQVSVSVLYRGTSLIRNSHPLGPYSRNMPRVLAPPPP